MAMDPELLELMPDTVVLNRYMGQDDSGNDAYSTTPESVQANITIAETRGGGGDHAGTYGPDVLLDGTIICEPVGIKPRDKIVFLGHTRYVSTVRTYRDAPEQGDYVQEITFEEAT